MLMGQRLWPFLWVESRRDSLGNGLRCQWHLGLGLGQQRLWHHRCWVHILYDRLGRVKWALGSGTGMLLDCGPACLGRNWSWRGVCVQILNAFRFHRYWHEGLHSWDSCILWATGLHRTEYWQVGHGLTSLNSCRSCCGVGLWWHWETNILTTSRMYYHSSCGNHLYC